MDELQNIQIELEQDLTTLDPVQLRSKYLSRKGIISELFRNLATVPTEEKSAYGKVVNELKMKIDSVIKSNSNDGQIQQERLNLFPVNQQILNYQSGHYSPISLLLYRIQDIFAGLHFSVEIGPELEEEQYNFDALNIPKDHPARDVWDTIWVSNGDFMTKLLRTHTSPVQVRYMQHHQPPIRIIAPGKVYRYEATDATHETVFHQVEGLMVDTTTSIATFKGVIHHFFQQLFDQEITMRLRPSYFPFTEPSFEIDIKINDTWLEVAGAGMVNRRVLENSGITDPKIQGFAFGFGVERLAMILYGIDDVRLIHSANIDFAQQFGKELI